VRASLLVPFHLFPILPTLLACSRFPLSFGCSSWAHARELALTPRHPRADIVISAAARHVHGALQQIGTLPPALVLQTRFIGTLALDRVIEPDRTPLGIGFDCPTCDSVSCDGSGVACAILYHGMCSSQWESASRCQCSQSFRRPVVLELGREWSHFTTSCMPVPCDADAGQCQQPTRESVREQSPLRLPLREPVSTASGNAAVIASLPVGATDGLLDVKCLPTGTGRAANGTHWQAEVYRGPTTQSRPAGIGSLGEPPAPAAGRAGRHHATCIASSCQCRSQCGSGESVTVTGTRRAAGGGAVPLLALPVALALAVPADGAHSLAAASGPPGAAGGGPTGTGRLSGPSLSGGGPGPAAGSLILPGHKGSVGSTRSTVRQNRQTSWGFTGGFSTQATGSSRLGLQVIATSATGSDNDLTTQFYRSPSRRIIQGT